MLQNIVSDKNINYVVKPIVAIVLMAAIYFGIKALIKAYKLRNVGRTTYNENNVDVAINYDNIVAAVHKATDSGFWVWKDTGAIEKQAEILSSYNDDEIKLMYNRFDVLFGKGESTMYDAFDVFCLTCPSISALLRRFERLGLN